MIRTPLRPLARILRARANGENPSEIEAENRRQRHEQMRDRARNRAESRLLVLGLCFFAAFGAIGLRMGAIAATEPEEPRTAAVGKTVLAAEDFTVVRGGRAVVRAAGVALGEGERLAIVGRSGSGKTTLARALVGLVPARGTVRLAGKAVAPASAELRRAVAMVFQDPSTSFDPRHSVLRIVTEPLFRSGLDAAARRERARQALAQVGLEDVLDRKPHAFSGGQRQRIAIARALIADPRVLIADEAVSALDAALRADVVRLLDGLARERGIALIFIAHDLALVRTLADRIVVMDDGAIVEDARREDLFAAPRHPASRALIAAAAEQAAPHG